MVFISFDGRKIISQQIGSTQNTDSLISSCSCVVPHLMKKRGLHSYIEPENSEKQTAKPSAEKN